MTGALCGCSFTDASIPKAPIEMARSDYTLLGETTAEDCGTYILGIDFGHLFSNEEAAVGGSAARSSSFLRVLLPFLGVFRTPEPGRALYKALAKIPNANFLIEPRVKVEKSGFLVFGWPIFGERCASVTAESVEIGDPLPFP
jgi:hypothetical protein